jgi:hypothetical protein
MTRLPAPEQWVLVKMNEMETAEMIERYIGLYQNQRKNRRLPIRASADAVRPALHEP